MEINFFEQDGVPQPRHKIKIERLAVSPYPDGWRVRINVDVTPFQERPNLELTIRAADGRTIAQLSIIETMHRTMEFTVHLRGVSNPAGDYICHADLYYDEASAAPQDQAEIRFTVTASA